MHSVIRDMKLIFKRTCFSNTVPKANAMKTTSIRVLVLQFTY